MPDEIDLEISGAPQGKDRPRFNRKTGQAWTPGPTKTAETDIRQAWENAGSPRLPDGAIGIRVDLYVQRPKGHFKKDGELSAQGLRKPYPDNKKPDVDNAIKLVMDALNSRAYRDDVQVVRATVERHWADWPSTKIHLYSLDGTAEV